MKLTMNHPTIAKPSPRWGAMLLVAGCAATLAACASDVPEGSPRSALLLTLDTTVPEALSCYGGPAGLTPHLDEIASAGVLYEKARTVAPITAPSHASMLTGLVPLRHSVRMNGSMVLPQGAVTLAELAREKGLRTAAFVAAVVLKREFGLDQGFEVYDEPSAGVSNDPHAASSRSGAVVIDSAIAWLEELDSDERFFAWVHLFDPHMPYRPSAAGLARAGGNAYLGELADVDDEVGRLVAAMRSLGVYESTMVVVIADHGEALERHREKSHGMQLFDTTIMVPMIVRHVDGWGGGTRTDEIVSVIDVFPTLSEALGLNFSVDASSDGVIDGISLFRRVAAADRGVYFETYMGYLAYGWSSAAGWADAKGKYVHSSAPEFFDLTHDPMESVNRMDDAGEAVAPYRAAIAALTERSRLQQVGLGGDVSRLQDQIEMLGYAGADTPGNALPDPLESSERPAPSAMREAGYDLLQAQTQLNRGNPSAALPIVRSVIERNPTNHGAHILHGQCLMASRRFSQAIDAFQRADDLRDDDWVEPQLNIAACYENLRRPAEAMAAYEIALAHGGPEPALRRLIELLEDAGRADDAKAFRALLPNAAE